MSKTAPNYPRSTIVGVVDYLMGKELSDRSFRRWLTILRLNKYKRDFEELEAKRIVALALLKKEQPKRKWTNQDVLALINSDDVQSALGKAQRKEPQKRENAEIVGADLPTIIKYVLGIKVSPRTFYRIAEKHELNFGLSRNLTQQEVQRFIDIIQITKGVK